jgi:hypothetical protein
MRFLVDAQLPPMLVRWLRERGHEAEHVTEIGMVGASDRDIAARRKPTKPCSSPRTRISWRSGSRIASDYCGCGAGTRPTRR